MDSTHLSTEALIDTAHAPLATASQDAREKKLAVKDIIDGLAKWRIWLTLAYQDVKLRYRRSILGPFWITISMAITTYSMGYLYGHLFHTDLQVYFPFLVSGMLSWGLISSLISDLTEAFSGSEGLIKQIKLPYSLYIHRVVTRNIIIFFQNIVV
jgi:lipopolysaccharide transport system permease protein